MGQENKYFLRMQFEQNDTIENAQALNETLNIELGKEDIYIAIETLLLSYFAWTKEPEKLIEDGRMSAETPDNVLNAGMRTYERFRETIMNSSIVRDELN